MKRRIAKIVLDKPETVLLTALTLLLIGYIIGYIDATNTLLGHIPW